MKLGAPYLLRGPGGLIRILWRPKIMTSASKIMARVIRGEEQAAKAYGREFEPWKAIHGFQLRTGAMRLNNSEANRLLELVYKAMKEENN